MTTLPPIRLNTERLSLRLPEESDADAVFAIYADTQVARYLARPAWTDIAQAHAWLARMRDEQQQASALQLMLQRNEDDCVLGTCTLFKLDFDNRRAEIGYTLASQYWGKGYMHEALVALLDHGFDALTLHRVEADIDPRNEPSARVLDRLGFQKEGHLRQRWQVAGEITDSDIYGLLAPEWRKRAE
ncbi:MAG: GNAT family N-acetyltransferase [Rhodanobacteraceae bacterium]